MKKCVILCLLLCLVSFSVRAEQTLFDIPCPEGWEYDEESYTDENTPSSMWLCEYYCGDEIYVDIYRDYVTEKAGMTLYATEEDALFDYKAELDDYYIATGMAMGNVVSESGIEFLLYADADEYGMYVIALTLINGWELSMVMETTDTMQPEDVSALRDMIASFTLLQEPENWTAPEIVADDGYIL